MLPSWRNSSHPVPYRTSLPTIQEQRHWPHLYLHPPWLTLKRYLYQDNWDNWEWPVMACGAD